ncbi:MAG: hypothetical protein AAF702_35410 [Chloroflexota bacterium]
MSQPIKGKIEFEPVGSSGPKPVSTFEAIIGIIIIVLVLVYVGFLEAIPQILDLIFGVF